MGKALGRGDFSRHSPFVQRSPGPRSAAAPTPTSEAETSASSGAAASDGITELIVLRLRRITTFGYYYYYYYRLPAFLSVCLSGRLSLSLSVSPSLIFSVNEHIN